MNDSGPRTLDVILAWEQRLSALTVVQNEVGGRIKARGTVQEIKQPGMYWTITSSRPDEVFRSTTVMWELWTTDRPFKSAVHSVHELEATVEKAMHRSLPITLPIAQPAPAEPVAITMWSLLESSYDSDPSAANWSRKIMRFRYELIRLKPLAPEN